MAIARFSGMRLDPRGEQASGGSMEEAKLKTEIAPPGRQEGAIGYILAWLIGIPIPILLLIFLLRGCT
jgi:hypothetical protein